MSSKATTRREDGEARRAAAAGGVGAGAAARQFAARRTTIIMCSSCASARRCRGSGKMSLHQWIADGLMAIFFLLVGLEVKREWYRGPAADAGRAAPADHRRGRRDGGAGADLSRRHRRRPGAGPRLGDPGGDRHRLRHRRARDPRPPRPAVDQAAARDHRHRRRHRRGDRSSRSFYTADLDLAALGRRARASARHGRARPVRRAPAVAVPGRLRAAVAAGAGERGPRRPSPACSPR